MADVVLHDALVEPEMLDYAPRASKIAVGKRCGRRSAAQQFINKQLVDAALTHDVVVRLKGGYPMLFGRADEEMRALEEAGLEYEVVPGITAALAAASAVKRSLTLRGVARSVALATRSRAADTEAVREHVDADSLVFYMGRDSAPDIARQLIDAGRPAATPVAIVEACSTPRERTLTLTLEGLAMGEAQQWLDPAQPSLLMIGEAFAERSVLNREDVGQSAEAGTVARAAIPHAA
jgi:uroporphyrin-III C-methyltransferase